MHTHTHSFSLSISIYLFLSLSLSPTNTHTHTHTHTHTESPNRKQPFSIITSIINTYMLTEIRDNFLFPSIENGFGADEVIFQDHNASCHRAKGIKAFLLRRHLKSMTWSENNPFLNPIDNSWRKFFFNGPSEGSLHQRRSIICHLGKLGLSW